MKICVFDNATGIHCQRYAFWLAKRGHEVHVITFLDGEIENVNIHQIGIKLKHLPFAHLLSLPLNIQQIKRIIKEISPDLVNGYYLTDYGLYAACTGFHPLVLTAQGSDVLINPQRFPFLRPLVKYALGKADYVVCRSAAVKEAAVRLGCGPNKAAILLIGVDTQEFSPKRRSKQVMQTLGIANSPVVISTRYLHPVYDVERLIRAVPLVLREIPDTKFIIAGEEKQRVYLQRLASSLNVSSNIRFVGWISHNELPKYLASSDIYVSTSLSDGTSNCLLEAMACELAPVVSNIPANQPWVTDKENGFLFPVRDHKMLAARIVHLINNRHVRQKFGQASRILVQERAESEQEMRRLERLYQELVR